MQSVGTSRAAVGAEMTPHTVAVAVTENSVREN